MTDNGVLMRWVADLYEMKTDMMVGKIVGGCIRGDDTTQQCTASYNIEGQGIFTAAGWRVEGETHNFAVTGGTARYMGASGVIQPGVYTMDGVDYTAKVIRYK